jgi:pilus assembly protein TadC
MLKELKDRIAKTVTLKLHAKAVGKGKPDLAEMQRMTLVEFRKLRAKHEKPKVQKYSLEHYLQRAGFTIDPKRLAKTIFNLCIIINLIYSFYLIYVFSTSLGYTLSYVFLIMGIVWFLLFFIVLFAMWLVFHIVLDLKILHRRVTIEQVLPDYLQLVSANVRAGVPIDQALWLAVRPRFGVLSKEIEHVAKETMSGRDLEDALQSFADKYDSKVLKRSINLLIEGMNAGGEVGDLLNKIAQNIHENQLLRKEVAANVTTYIIFITVAAVVGAPLLFALATQLLHTVTTLTSTVSIPQGVGGIGINFGKAGITKSDFQIFAVVSMIITSLFSSMIIAIIRKGEAKAGFKYFPVFVVSAIVIYFIAVTAMSSVFSTFI